MNYGSGLDDENKIEPSSMHASFWSAARIMDNTRPQVPERTMSHSSPHQLDPQSYLASGHAGNAFLEMLARAQGLKAPSQSQAAALAGMASMGMSSAGGDTAPSLLRPARLMRPVPGWPGLQQPASSRAQLVPQTETKEVQPLNPTAAVYAQAQAQVRSHLEAQVQQEVAAQHQAAIQRQTMLQRENKALGLKDNWDILLKRETKAAKKRSQGKTGPAQQALQGVKGTQGTANGYRAASGPNSEPWISVEATP